MTRAACFHRFGGPEVLEFAELPDPRPGPGQVRIAVRAAGVNASDWKKRQGLMDEELPQTLGHEAAGLVDEVGAVTLAVMDAGSAAVIGASVGAVGPTAGGSLIRRSLAYSLNCSPHTRAVSRGATWS